MKESHSLSDAVLVVQYQSGKKEALRILVQRWHKIFCEKAYWVTRNRASAKDVAQESWVVIMANINKLNKPKSFKSWALRIVYTKAVDYEKSKIKARKILQEAPINSSFSRKEGHDAIELRKKMMDAILKLSFDKQEIIRLFYKDELSIYEISDLLKIPVGTVKSRLFKAREKLKSIIKNKDYEK